MIRAQLMRSDLQLGSGDAVTTSSSAAWDLMDCDYAVLDVIVGVRFHASTGATVLSVLTSDDTVVTNHATVVANQTITPGSTTKLVRFLMDTRASKRYLRLTTAPAGTVATQDAVVHSAVLHKFRNRVDADAAADLTASTNDTVVQVG